MQSKPAWPADSRLLCFSPMLIPLIINKQDCTQSVKGCPQISWLTKRAGVSNITIEKGNHGNHLCQDHKSDQL